MISGARPRDHSTTLERIPLAGAVLDVLKYFEEDEDARVRSSEGTIVFASAISILPSASILMLMLPTRVPTSLRAVAV